MRVADVTVTVGPDSVGFRLNEEAMTFGGQQLTASDLAIARGWADFGDPSCLADLDPDIVSRGTACMQQIVATSVDKVKTKPEPMPMILVGGGSIIVKDIPQGVSDMLRPNHAGVANAIGAAIGQVSGEIDRIFTIVTDQDRKEALEQARQEAMAKAIEAGASESSLEITEIDSFPLQYLPGGATRIVCRAVGDLEIKEMAYG